MAEKKVTGFVKLQIPAGAANPAPPVGPALGAQGGNLFISLFHLCDIHNLYSILMKILKRKLII